MALKLALASESHWRKVNAPHLVALVRAGIRYQDGVHVSAPEARERHAEQLAEGIAAQASPRGVNYEKPPVRLGRGRE